jgi:diguanylate cyclase (GGDEF)-like protein
VPQAGATPGMRGWRMVLLGSALSAVGLSVILMPHSGWNRLPTAAAMLAMIAVILSRLQRAVADLAGAEQTMRHQATHDQLTGVANRARLMDEMRHAVTRSPTLFFVDLDGFKAINDTRGHHTGDIVLKVVAERLTGIVRSTDSVARLGGDEFVVVCTGLGPDEVTALATRIERTLAEPIPGDGGPVTVGSSIGILTLPYAADAGHDVEDLISDLLRTADAAMYEAKRDGGGTRIVEYALSA